MSFEDLPLEMICEIFQKLSLSDLINCKQVDKRCYHAVEMIRVRGLSVKDNKGSNNPDYCHPNLLNNLLNREKLIIINKLVCLKIKHFDHKFDYQKINLFKELVHLEMLPVSNLQFSLSKLEILKFNSVNIYKIDLNCPKLQELHYTEWEDVNALVLKNPETIKKLHCNFYGKKLERFRCLEQLESIFCYGGFKLLIDDTVWKLLFLNSINFKDSIDHLRFFWVSVPGINNNLLLQVKVGILLQDFNRQRILKNSKLVLCFAGLRLTSSASIERLIFQKESGEISEEMLYANNWQLLEETVPFVENVNYSLLVKQFDLRIPEDYFKRFFNLRKVFVTERLQDENHFLSFLTDLQKPLKELNLANSILSQSACDQLPKICPALVSFGFANMAQCQLNFSFLSKFKKLDRLAIKFKGLNFRLTKSFELGCNQYELRNEQREVLLEAATLDAVVARIGEATRI